MIFNADHKGECRIIGETGTRKGGEHVEMGDVWGEHVKRGARKGEHVKRGAYRERHTYWWKHTIVNVSRFSVNTRVAFLLVMKCIS